MEAGARDGSRHELHDDGASRRSRRRLAESADKMIVFPAGSFTDTVTRVMLDRLSNGLGQPVVVENKAGASGVIGVSEAARAAPDGYTLLVTNSSSVTINPQIYKKIPLW